MVSKGGDDLRLRIVHGRRNGSAMLPDRATRRKPFDPVWLAGARLEGRVCPFRGAAVTPGKGTLSAGGMTNTSGWRESPGRPRHPAGVRLPTSCCLEALDGAPRVAVVNPSGVFRGSTCEAVMRRTARAGRRLGPTPVARTGSRRDAGRAGVAGSDGRPRRQRGREGHRQVVMSSSTLPVGPPASSPHRWPGHDGENRAEPGRRGWSVS